MTNAIDLEEMKVRADDILEWEGGVEDVRELARSVFTLIAEVERLRARDAAANTYQFGCLKVDQDWRVHDGHRYVADGATKEEAIALAQRLAAEESGK